jgi:pimeloyl-ACP methyl ester carboxylesterase
MCALADRSAARREGDGDMRGQAPGEYQRPIIVKHDGRALAVETWGKPGGFPVFLLHGMPGSRLGPRPRGIVLYRLGVELISYDRPGYGESGRHEGRTVADAGADIVAIADALEIPAFSVVGRSGGGPHALACAAHAPDRVVRTAVLVGSAPSDSPGLDWYSGMTDENQEVFTRADGDAAGGGQDQDELIASLSTRADEVGKDPDSMIRYLLPQLAASDRRVVEDRAMRRLLTETYAEAVRRGGDGWIDDVVALRNRWGFTLAQVICPVLLWHGADDRFVPVAHTYWLRDKLRSTRMYEDTVRVEVAQGTAHFGAVEILPEVLGWLSESRVLT